MLVFYILFIAYLFAINFYAFNLIRTLKDKEATDPSNKLFDGRLALTGIMGGAITIYVCMFIYKYRLSNLFLMISMPLIAVLNVYLCIALFRFRFFIF